MKNKLIKTVMLLAGTCLFVSCKLGATLENPKAKIKSESMIGHITTKEERDLLTPDLVLQDFKAGNERFKNSIFTNRVHSEEIRKAATDGQFPKAMVLSCLDSRVPVEDVFDQGIGDVFVGRVAGNFVNTDLLGSMEFACKVAGAKLIIVMGHQHCGAIKGAIDDVHLGNITSMLANLKPAVKMSQNFQGEKSSKNEAFVKLVAQNNIKYTIDQIVANSEILRTMKNNGEIKIVGAFYTLRTGNLEFLE